MIKNIIYIIVFISFLIPLNAHATNKSFCDDKQKYCMTYPDIFIEQSEIDLSENKKFLTKDKQSELTVSVSYKMTPDEALSYMYNTYKGNDIKSRKLTKDYFIISGVTKEKRFYEKTKNGKRVIKKIKFVKEKLFYLKTFLKGEQYISFRLVYPQSEKSLFDKIIPTLKIDKQ